MTTIALNKREIPLYFSCYEIKQIQEEIASPFGRAMSLVLGRNPDDREDESKYGTTEHLEAAAKLIRILGNAGLEESGAEADLTDRFVMRKLNAAALVEAVNAAIDVINEMMGGDSPEGQQTDSEPAQADGESKENKQK